MDTAAVAFDMLMGVVLAFAPALADKAILDAMITKAATARASQEGGKGLAKATAAVIKVGAQGKTEDPNIAKNPDFVEGFDSIMTAGDCTLDLREEVHAKKDSRKELLKAAVKAAQTCGKQVFSQLNGTDLIQSLLSVLKLVPETVEAELAGINNFITNGKYKLTSVYADLERFNPYAHHDPFLGTRYNDTDRIVVNPDGTGTDYYQPPWKEGPNFELPPCGHTAFGCRMTFRITKTWLTSGTNIGQATAIVTSSNAELFSPVGHTLNFSLEPDDSRIFTVNDPAITHGTGQVQYFCRQAVKQECSTGITPG
jgi:hypothetical protein